MVQGSCSLTGFFEAGAGQPRETRNCLGSDGSTLRQNTQWLVLLFLRPLTSTSQ